MESNFIQQWYIVREKQGSNIVAGLDPCLYDMGRGEKGLPEDVDLYAWSCDYIDAVAPYVAAVKINQAFFQGVGQRQVLSRLVERIKKAGLLVISDNKIADIGSTNDAWVYWNKQLGFDAMTCAPYAGNIEGTIQSAHMQGVGIMTMGLMSNPEYKTEMSFKHHETGESIWHNRVRRSLEANADAIVVGGTYELHDPNFTEFISMTNDSPVLYLIPGIGAQGGSVDSFLASGIDAKKCMICSSRGLMFPKGQHSTPAEQAIAAKALQESFYNAVNK